jgi:DNA-binding GntR family transcriptional regulator
MVERSDARRGRGPKTGLRVTWDSFSKRIQEHGVDENEGQAVDAADVTTELKSGSVTRREALVQSLLADILQGRLRAGQHLVTQDLAERFEVSHTPIREALIALGGIGVVTLAPHRGAVVRQMTARDVREVCHVRRVLECEAVRGACGRIELPRLQQLGQDLQKLLVASKRASAKAVAQAVVLDSTLHDLISKSSRNAFLAQELNRLKLLFRAFRDVSWAHDGEHHSFGRLREETQEHLAIVNALLVGDRRRAARAMSDHIRSGMAYWTRALPGMEHAADLTGHRRQSQRPVDRTDDSTSGPGTNGRAAARVTPSRDPARDASVEVEPVNRRRVTPPARTPARDPKPLNQAR